MRVLFQTVGTGGPDNPVWEALAYTIEQRGPDLVVWLCSEQTAQTTLPRLRSHLHADSPSAGRIECCDDPEHVDQLADSYARIIDSVRLQHPTATFEADFTSGTKAMSAALAVAAAAAGATRLLYATGSRDASGRVMQTDKLITLSPEFIGARRELAQLARLFDHGQFAAVAQQSSDLCKRLAGAGHDGKDVFGRASSLAFIADAYRDWDLFKWNAAHEKLKGVNRERAELVAAGWDVKSIERQRDLLKTIARRPSEKQPPAPERLVDLLCSAQRCLDRGRYDDAVARLYRLIEYICQARLHRYDITDTSAAPVERLRSVAPRYEQSQRHWSDRRAVKLGLYDSLSILGEAGDRVGLWLCDRYFGNGVHSGIAKGLLGALLDKRNRSLLAHGTDPIDHEPAKDLITIARAAVEEHLDDLTGGHGPARLLELEQDATFHKCPWSINVV